jgi:metal-dependent amidase/aminoacylase/carboxypeptidase family protein
MTNNTRKQAEIADRIRNYCAAYKAANSCDADVRYENGWYYLTTVVTTPDITSTVKYRAKKLDEMAQTLHKRAQEQAR